ncbi:DNA-binding protein [Pedobacter metabolipauper]|nr:DNA-binding protein [Pedobacter metabolipauper]
MIKLLRCVIELLRGIDSNLRLLFEEMQSYHSALKLAAEKDHWLDSTTVKFMLRVSDRTLYTYVRNGKITVEKRGAANFYLESTVIKLMNNSGR